MLRRRKPWGSSAESFERADSVDETLIAQEPHPAVKRDLAEPEQARAPHEVDPVTETGIQLNRCAIPALMPVELRCVENHCIEMQGL